jgi:hypothetical protein
MAVVRFTQSGSGCYIVIDGAIKGHISKGPDCYISVTKIDKPWTECGWDERHTVARFKYSKPMQNAKEWCKTVFSVLAVADVCELLRTTTPYHLGKDVETGRLRI